MVTRASLRLVACAALGLAAGQASADTRSWDLRVRSAASAVGLRMRQAVAQGPAAAAPPAPANGPEDVRAAAPGAPAAPARAGAGSDGRRRDRRAGEDMPAGPRLDEQVVFRFNLGFGLDGAQPSS
ncbi:MAG TPA: hypothetical protein VNM90_16545, partial [Haliangium sp.]|nr:hypothetical protein [Haliangium sp.]